VREGRRTRPGGGDGAALQPHRAAGGIPPLAAHRGPTGLIIARDRGGGRLISPFAGIDPRISSNPISIALPVGHDYWLLDMRCSVSARGKFKVAYNKNDAHMHPGYASTERATPQLIPGP